MKTHQSSRHFRQLLCARRPVARWGQSTRGGACGRGRDKDSTGGKVHQEKSTRPCGGIEDVVFIFHGEMGEVKAGLGLGRGAEILLRGLFLQLRPHPSA